MKICSILLLMVVATFSYAQQCENLIELSKINKSIIADKRTVESHAANFCDEKSSLNTNTSGTSAGASYKFLSASYGKSNASVDEVASKYCSASNDNKASDGAYEEYIQSIAPGAYGAYDACINLEKEIIFDLDVQRVLSTEFALLTRFTSRRSSRETAEVVFSAGPGIACSWLNQGVGVELITIKHGDTTQLTCTRGLPADRSYVTVFRKDTSETNNSLTIPWAAYTAEGVATETIERLQTSLSEAEQKIEQLSADLEVERRDRQAALTNMNQYARQVQNTALANYGTLCTQNANLCARTIHQFCDQAGYWGGVAQEWNDQFHDILCIGRR